MIDLGLALQAENEDERVTREGTTVGTVDYMAPEQARDSRATSIQSDMYSLGCTFYFLLTGVPPYPGGDITEKLTRHAKAPVPDVCDLRQDVAPSLAAILTRMMAKRPDDRFGSYDELIGTLDEAPVDRNEQEQGIALLPLDGEPEPAPPALPDETNPDRESPESGRNGTGDATYQVVSLADLASELDEDYRPQPASRQSSVEPPAPLLRRTPLVENDVEDTDSTEPNAAESALPSRPPVSVSVWVISFATLGVAGVLLVIGLFQFFGSVGWNGTRTPLVRPMPVPF